jgi:hypothetical protein
VGVAYLLMLLLLLMLLRAGLHGCCYRLLSIATRSIMLLGERGLLASRQRGWWLLTVDVVAVAAAGVDCGGVGTAVAVVVAVDRGTFVYAV